MSAAHLGAAPSPARPVPPLRAAGVLSIAGTAVDLRADEPASLEPFLAAHRHFPAREGRECLRVEVLTGGAFRTAPRIRFPGLAPAAVMGLVERGDEGRFALLSTTREEGVTLYRDRLLELAPALAVGPEGCHLLEPRLLTSYLELLLLNAALDRAPELTAAHAAVVARGGRAALVCGDGGVGKTTLTLALLQGGCTYLTDEVALLDAGSRRVRAYPRSLGIRAGTLALLGAPDLGPGAFRTTSLTGDRKWVVDPAAVAPAGVGAVADVEHVWFLRGFGPEPQFAEIEPWEAARRFARSLRQSVATPMDRLWTALEVVRHCRVREVIAGPPAATASALIQLMEPEKGG